MELPYSNLKLRHWNPGATAPLILPVHVICNTSDEAIYDNIRRNSRATSRWQQLEQPHERVAVICGSGPSLKETMDDVRALRDAGGVVFALNGAAQFLVDNGIMPDYQVILDARAETAQLVGPAREHLFASQVHPDTFAKKPGAILWQLQVEGIDDLLPAHDTDYCLIGGAASVGNTATCLAYAMGYRALELFGYDSSNRGEESHAFRQPMNDGDPMASVAFHGKHYTCSLTMKLQAERFMSTAKALQDAGVTINVHGYGLLPDMWNAPPEVLAEHEKYERMWGIDAYREVSPGEGCVGTFLEIAQPRGTVIDFGCGTGRASIALAAAGLDVKMIDFAPNCLDAAAKPLPFVVHDLTKPTGLRADYGFCADVMEHIPTADVRAVIDNIMAAVPRCFFQISLVEDSCGVLIGHPLHLTVKPFGWWLNAFAPHQILWSRDSGASAMFYVHSTT